MHISVIIPTCHRKQALLTLLQSLSCSSYPVAEVIIVDGGSNRLRPSDYGAFTHLDIRYLFSSPSVCVQRNIGIRSARYPWIFLCDDDMEVPPDYLQKLAAHIAAHPEAGAVSGLVLQKENRKWKASYPVQSPVELVWKFIFRLSIWGEIICKANNRLISMIKLYYRRRGNHLSPAGWPVITDFSGEYFIVPVYGLGASLIKKEWLLHSPYDEVLDSHGIGDHYGVAAGFPVAGVHIVKNAVVYHHQSPVNRLQHPVQYFRRVLALDYFIKKQSRLKHIKKRWLLWSLTGNLLLFLWARKGQMARSSLRAIYAVVSGRNPYCNVSKAAHLPNLMFPDPYIPCHPWPGKALPRKILAIRLQATGDTVITLPYLQYLRRYLPPSVKIDMLTRKETDDVPRNIYLFDKVFSIGGKRNFKKQLFFTFLMLPKLLMQRYDVILDLQNNLISRIVRKTIAPKAWSVFDKSSSRSAGERTRLTIEAAGLGINQMDTCFQLKDQNKGQKILLNNGWDGSAQLVILNPAAAFETRNWPLQNYVRFAQLWEQRFPHTQFVALGTSFIADKTSFLVQAMDNCLINLVGNTGPSDAFAVIQHVTLVLSEDSGLMHMAWVSGIPTLALFGGSRSDWARPLGAHSRFLDASDLSCGHCMLEVCPYGDVHCLTRYTPESVFAEAEALLQETSIKQSLP